MKAEYRFYDGCRRAATLPLKWALHALLVFATIVIVLPGKQRPVVAQSDERFELTLRAVDEAGKALPVHSFTVVTLPDEKPTTSGCLVDNVISLRDARQGEYGFEVHLRNQSMDPLRVRAKVREKRDIIVPLVKVQVNGRVSRDDGEMPATIPVRLEIPWVEIEPGVVVHTLFERLTNADGEFEFDRTIPGSAVLGCRGFFPITGAPAIAVPWSPPRLLWPVRFHRSLASPIVLKPGTKLDLGHVMEFTGAAVEVRVSATAAGQSLKGASVSIWTFSSSSQAPSGLSSEEWCVCAHTDSGTIGEDGHTEPLRLPPGRYRVRLQLGSDVEVSIFASQVVDCSAAGGSPKDVQFAWPGEPATGHLQVLLKSVHAVLAEYRAKYGGLSFEVGIRWAEGPFGMPNLKDLYEASQIPTVYWAEKNADSLVVKNLCVGKYKIEPLVRVMYVPPQNATREDPGDFSAKHELSKKIEREIEGKITPQMGTVEIGPGRTTIMEVKYER